MAVGGHLRSCEASLSCAGMTTSEDTPAHKTTERVDGPVRSPAFVTTHWSVVLKAGRADTPNAAAALEQLCRNYWHPLYAYVRRAGHSPEDAQDLVQEFFARLLERNTIGRADPGRGRFRSFLLTVLKNFLANEWDKQRAKKRGGEVKMLSLQFDTAETRLAPAHQDTPDKAFDRQWALSLLEVVLGRLRHEYASTRRDDLFRALKDTLSGARSEIPYRELAARLGMSEGAVKVAAHRLRQRYRELLREEIANTVSGPEEIEAELRDLFRALAE
jgi:RNA polymerase sigma factor (sigma-70 family)